MSTRCRTRREYEERVVLVGRGVRRMKQVESTKQVKKYEVCAILALLAGRRRV